MTTPVGPHTPKRRLSAPVAKDLGAQTSQRPRRRSDPVVPQQDAKQGLWPMPNAYEAPTTPLTPMTTPVGPHMPKRRLSAPVAISPQAQTSQRPRRRSEPVAPRQDAKQGLWPMPNAYEAPTTPLTPLRPLSPQNSPGADFSPSISPRLPSYTSSPAHAGPSRPRGEAYAHAAPERATPAEATQGPQEPPRAQPPAPPKGIKAMFKRMFGQMTVGKALVLALKVSAVSLCLAASVALFASTPILPILAPIAGCLGLAITGALIAAFFLMHDSPSRPRPPPAAEGGSDGAPQSSEAQTSTNEKDEKDASATDKAGGPDVTVQPTGAVYPADVLTPHVPAPSPRPAYMDASHALDEKSGA